MDTQMAAVMLSMNQKSCQKLTNHNQTKTIEIRKTKPKLSTPFKCYIYKSRNSKHDFVGSTSKTAGKVIGEFICNRIDKFKVFENSSVQNWMFFDLNMSGMSYEDVANYVGINNYGYAWHISDLIIYDTPKELREFSMKCRRAYCSETCKHYNDDCYINVSTAYGRYKNIRRISTPPKSWCYVELIAQSLMTLDEAIEHCKENEDCTRCGQEHKQLREWLEELKMWRAKYAANSRS